MRYCKCRKPDYEYSITGFLLCRICGGHPR